MPSQTEYGWLQMREHTGRVPRVLIQIVQVEEARGVFSVNAELAKEVIKVEEPAPVLGPAACPPSIKPEAAIKPETKPAAEKTRKAPEGPVSKWTLVDDEEDTTFDRPE